MSIPYPAEHSARVSMRIAPDALETIREAAIAQQQDITGFVLGAAMDRARAVVLEERKLRARLEERKLRARLEERALRAGSAATAPTDDDDFDNDVADDNRWLFPEMAPMVREAWRALGLPSQ